MNNLSLKFLGLISLSLALVLQACSPPDTLTTPAYPREEGLTLLLNLLRQALVQPERADRERGANQHELAHLPLLLGCLDRRT
jgi:hypothetical protein